MSTQIFNHTSIWNSTCGLTFSPGRNLQNLTQKYNQTFAEFNPQAQAKIAIEELQKLQIADGGFAAFPGQEKSDPWVSSYAGESLIKANQSFPDLVDSKIISSLKMYKFFMTWLLFWEFSTKFKKIHSKRKFFQLR